MSDKNYSNSIKKYSSSLDSQYNFKIQECKWQEFWKDYFIYKWDSNEDFENNFSIDAPPPTVSGDLHMGHVYSYCQADIIARFQRMKGKNVFYSAGFDDNGLPTERLVEKKKNVRASSLDRDEFIKLCEEVVESEEQNFEKIFNNLGLSYDWSAKYQTISPVSRKLSQMSFLDLVEKNYIYRSRDPILWDPVDQTALAQADIEDKEKDSFMHEIIFHSSLGDKLKIATTRPELLPACVAVFYNPNDERYKNLEGKFAITPLFRAKVPILPDENVDIEKGTGLVMCCTFGDTTDIHWWKTHSLPLREVLDKKGRMASISFESYSENASDAEEIYNEIVDLYAKDARKKIIDLLSNSDHLISSTAIKHNVKCAERSGAPLEIICTDQWFVKTIEFKDQILEKANEINWHPKSMKIRLENWVNAISWDWCISRQRYFGVPFPAWYSKRAGEEGKILYASKDQLPVDPFKDLPEGYSRDEVEADKDVMDTWATSSITPQMASQAINKNYSCDYERHRKLFPFDLRPQGHEIIRTWAFYTILKSLLHENSIPWSNIMISGWCLAEDRTKMSKSKGNIISPLSLFEEYGSDPIRYWSSNSRLGADTAVCRDTLQTGKKLVNKIWNASKFASQHFYLLNSNEFLKDYIFEGGVIKKYNHEIAENIEVVDDSEIAKIQKIISFKKYLISNSITKNSDLKTLIKNSIINYSTDIWILFRLSETISKATNLLDNYSYASARELIDHFFWNDFCNNYLEIVKKRCYNESGSEIAEQASAIFTLKFVLKNILKLYAPYIPFVTESVFQALYSEIGSVHARGMWPKFEFVSYKKENIEDTELLIIILDNIRKFKSSKNISIKTPIQEIVLDFRFSHLSENSLKDLQDVTNAILITRFKSSDEINQLDNSFEIINCDDELSKIAIKL